MSEMGESYDPGPWGGFSYKSARAAYADNDLTAGRGYGTTRHSVAKKSLDDLVPERISTNAKSPVVIITDGTGSMGDFPRVIFEKLPLLDLGIADYLQDAEISLAMVGDAGAGDKYPLQVQKFTKGKGLVDTIGKLVIEGGGGGNEEESYELAALYYARNVEMPKASKPVLIYICDEGIYKNVDSGWGKDHARVDIKERLSTEKLFDELKRKYSVYCIRKHYNDGISGDKMTGSNLRIHKQWEQYVGADRMAILNDPRRVVDVIFGLLANETNKTEFFDKELAFRQTPDQVNTVKKSLLAVNNSVKKLSAGKSVLRSK